MGTQNTQQDMQPQGGGSMKYVIGIVVLGAIILGVSFMNKSQPTSASNDTTGATSQTQTLPNETITPGTSGVQTTTTTAKQTVEVDYTDSGFTPNAILINTGDTVKFVNKSSEDMWVGSDFHPSHTLYSGTSLREHCPDTAGTTFDQCGTGNEYSFTFQKVGAWTYHNHKNSSMKGSVSVK